MRKILGMDIGGTHFRFGLVDEDYALTSFAIRSTQSLLAAGSAIENLSAAIRAYLDGHQQGVLPEAISIGFPSTIDADRRVVRSTPNIAPLQNFHVVEQLEAIFSCPIYINRDVNFLLLYDLWHLKVPEKALVAGVYYGTGLGNAVSLGGRLLLGKNGVAAELGHIPVPHFRGICPCGNEGCLELMASGKRLLAIHDEFFPQSSLSRIFAEHGETEVVREFIDALAIAAATEVNIFDPDQLILGGGLVQMEAFPRKMLEELIVRRARKPYPAENLSILYSDASQENGVIGAGIYAFKRLKEKDYL